METDKEELRERLNALETRVEKLEQQAPATPEGDPTQGVITYQGNVKLDDAEYEYIWQRPADLLTETSWDATMERLAATAHPVRGKILQHLLHQPSTVADLKSAKLVTSTGTAYHHLSALQSAGWISKTTNGIYSIKPKRVIALLSLVLTMEEA